MPKRKAEVVTVMSVRIDSPDDQRGLQDAPHAHLGLLLGPIQRELPGFRREPVRDPGLARPVERAPDHEEVLSKRGEW